YQEIKDVLLSTVDPIDALAGITVSGGRLNAAAAATGTPPPDTTGPRVNSSTPSGVVASAVASLRVAFNEAVVNVDLADIGSFTGPGGAITPLTVAEVTGSGGRQYDVTFASQSAEGTYAMLVGPGDVQDASGNLMDQDRDGIQGEAIDDIYTASFTIDYSPGPDGFGYEASMVALDPIDLAAGAPGVFTILDDVDDDFAAVDLGSNTFAFYGTAYSGAGSLFVSSNGLITFGAGNWDYTNYDLTDYPDEATIAPLWDDWVTYFDFADVVLGKFEDVDSDGAMDRLIIEWSNVWRYDGSPSEATFQAILTLNSSSLADPFVLNYPDIDTGDGSAEGGSATVGIKDAGPQGDNRLLISYNADSPYFGTGSGLRFSLAPSEPSFSIGNVSVSEGHTSTTTASFVVTLSSDPAGPVTVDYTTADGSATTADGDYQFTSGTLTFNPGEPLTQTIPVLVNGDRRGEFNETFVVNITSAAPVIDGQGTGTILDDEPTVSISDATPVTEGNSGTTAMSFTVTLSAAYDADVTVGFATQDGSATTADNDYQAAPASAVATIAAGSITTIVLIDVNGDENVEADETLLVILSNPTHARIVDDQATGTIRNDDDATKFYVVDASSDRTYEYDPTGAAVENYSLRSGNNDPRGAASDATGERVWVIDNDDFVYVYDAAGNSLGSWKANGLKTPDGIASDGVDIWIVDRGRDRVYRYGGAASRTSGNADATSSFALGSGNSNPKGIETDGTHLWVVDDNRTNKVFKYNLSGALVGSWTIDGTNTSPTGITLDPSNPSDIWIVDAGRDQVFQYTAAASRTSGSQSPSAVFNLATGNGNPQGIADPPPPAAAPVLSGEAEAVEFDDLRVSTTAASGGSRSAAAPALSWAWEAIPNPPARGVTAARPTAETPSLLHEQPVVYATSSRAIASGGSVGPLVLDIDGNGLEDDEPISLSLVAASDAVFADVMELAHILDED
ncbi:MAG: hypothetical protein KY476_25490, partial [Planctomycetes bacterium]|nr:hypothetical protein [Planctomycetota bacterium]